MNSVEKLANELKRKKSGMIKLEIYLDDGSVVEAEAKPGSFRSVIRFEGKLYERDNIHHGSEGTVVTFIPALVLDLDVAEGA